MTKYCDKCGSEIANENAKFCDKCGTELKFKTNLQNNIANQNIPIDVNEKSMALAMIISFFLSGLGIAYAGNIVKGVGYFLGCLVLLRLCSYIFSDLIYFLINTILWIIGLVLTYQEVNQVNQQKRMLLMNSIK